MPEQPEFDLRPFRPAWWVPGANAHTIFGRFMRTLDQGPLRRRRVELPDGDFVDLDEGPETLPDGAPAVLILHGLEGCSSSNYVANASREMANRGIRAIRMNFRGCSGEMNRLSRFYNAGETGDLDFLLKMLKAEQPERRLGAIGFSLGGNVLLKYLGEKGGQAGELLGAAAAVSVPFDLAAGTNRLEQRGWTSLYTLYFIRKLRRKAIEKRALLAAECDVDGAISSRSVRQYDEALTARLHGFRDAWHYYEESSCAGYLPGITIPTLILHSLDDPFLPPADVPLASIRENPCLIDGTTERGGHVGFIEGAPWRPSFWAESESARFFDLMLGNSSIVPSSVDAPAENPG